MTFIFVDDFEAGSLSSDYANVSGSTVTAEAAHSGGFGLQQVSTSEDNGNVSLSNTFLPDGYTYCFASFWHNHAAHTSGNSAVITVENRSGSDHFNMFVNHDADGKFWWDLANTDNGQSPDVVTVDKWYHIKLIVFFGDTTWTAQVWIDGVKQPPISTSGKTVSDVRAIHIGNFDTNTNTRYYDDIQIFLLKAHPETVMAFQDLSTEDLLRLFLLKFITSADVTEYETTTSDYLGKLVNTEGDVLNVNDTVA